MERDEFMKLSNFVQCERMILAIGIFTQFKSAAKSGNTAHTDILKTFLMEEYPGIEKIFKNPYAADALKIEQIMYALK